MVLMLEKQDAAQETLDRVPALAADIDRLQQSYENLDESVKELREQVAELQAGRLARL